MTAQTILPANTLSSGGFDVTNSIRFEKADTSYLGINYNDSSRTGNRKKWTWSGWIKLASFATNQDIFGRWNGDGKVTRLRIQDDGSVRFHCLNGDGNHEARFTSTGLIRDPAAWGNIIVAMDTTQSTDTNRLKIYWNGAAMPGTYANYPDEDEQFASLFNSNVAHVIGFDNGDTEYYYDGYLCEVNFIDDAQLTPTSFGEFEEDSGIWRPIDTSGLTFGTTGYRLEFKQTEIQPNSGAADADGLGADTSGRANHWTSNSGLAVTDQSTDTCTNNFCTWNFLDRFYTSAVFSEGNTVVKTPNASQTYCTSTFGLSSGKWYVEVLTEDGSNRDNIGIVDSVSLANDSNNNLYAKSKGYSYRGWTSNPGVWNNGSKLSGTFASYSSPNTISIALDLDNNKLYFAKDGTWQNSGDPTSGATGTGAISITAASALTNGEYFIAVGDEVTSDDTTYRGNFGSPFFAISSGNADGNGHGNFEYAVPSGYFAICTKNLAEHG